MPSFLRTSAGTEICPWAVTLDLAIDIPLHYRGNGAVSSTVFFHRNALALVTDGFFPWILRRVR